MLGNAEPMPNNTIENKQSDTLLLLLSVNTNYIERFLKLKPKYNPLVEVNSILKPIYYRNNKTKANSSEDKIKANSYEIIYNNLNNFKYKPFNF